MNLIPNGSRALCKKRLAEAGISNSSVGSSHAANNSVAVHRALPVALPKTERSGRP